MADRGLSKEIQRLYAFACRLASPFTDSRRRNFIEDMIPGLLISGHVHLTKVARAISPGEANIHSVEKRLSTHLGGEHWDMSPLASELLTRLARLVTPATPAHRRLDRPGQALCASWKAWGTCTTAATRASGS